MARRAASGSCACCLDTGPRFPGMPGKSGYRHSRHTPLTLLPSTDGERVRLRKEEFREMAKLPEYRIRNRHDIARFETEMALEERLPERSVLDVFTGLAARLRARVALTMLMPGAMDEQPHRVTYGELLRLVRRAANLFVELGGRRPGVAYMLPNLIETHATLWGAETAG